MWLRVALLTALCGIVASRDPIGQNLIVLVIDGYGASLLNSSRQEATFGLRQIADNGVQTESLRPVFPTHNYPSWISLVTGLHPESHNIIADYILDEKTGLTFEAGRGATDNDDVWWYGGKAPIWYTAGKAGVDVHCYWFANCHYPHGDMIVQVPDKRKYDANQPDQTELLPHYFASIIERIKKYQAYKQQFFLLRYQNVETALQQFGEGSDEVDQALSRIDLHVHDLQQKLEENGLFESTNLVVLSTHGLRAIDEEETFYLEECISDFDKIKRVVNLHAVVMIFAEPDSVDSLYFQLKVCEQWMPMGDYEEGEKPDLVTAYRGDDLPEHLHWAKSKFLPSIVLLTRPGVSVLTRELPSIPNGESVRDFKQTAGWEPSVPDMHGIFLARGPAFKKEEKFDTIELIDIYQVLLNILGVEPPHQHNGTWANVELLLSDGWEDRPNSERFNGVVSTFLSLSLTLSLLTMLFGL